MNLHRFFTCLLTGFLFNSLYVPAASQDAGGPKVFQNQQFDVRERKKRDDLRRLAAMPPKERVEEVMRQWRTNEETQAANDVIVASGAEVVPFLIQEIRKSKPTTYARLDLVLFLCDIDRFEPCSAGNLNCFQVREICGVEPLRKGAVSPYRVVDGRIIGKEGLDVVRWAATQDDDVLQTFALAESGFLTAEARTLPISELVERWKKAIHANHRFWFPDFYADRIYLKLGEVILERPDEALPLLVKFIKPKTDKDLLDQVLQLVMRMDSTSVRLRGTEAGRNVISAIEHLFETGYLPNSIIDAEYGQREKERILDSFKNDERYPLQDIMEGLLVFYGVPAWKPASGYHGGEFRDPEEIRAFVDFLTKRDPYFPSWEFPGLIAYNQSLNPRYNAKLARFYEAWVAFQAERKKTPAS